MSVKIQTMGDFRKYLSGELISVYPAGEIASMFNIIVKTLFDKERFNQLTDPGWMISGESSDRIMDIVLQLRSGKPLQYILGETVFYNCRIKVNENVLIPRQETEELTDLVIKENPGFSGRLIDFGTGSGCIAVALGRNLPDAAISALDNSPKAIEVAKLNAELNNVRIDFIETDILNPELHKFQKMEIIVSNPPYVKESEKIFMHRNVLDFEPHSALFVPDGDPLVFYRGILSLSKHILAPGGKIYFEINEAEGRRVTGMMQMFGFGNVIVLKDLNNKERIVRGIYNGQ